MPPRADWRKLCLLERLSLPDAVHTFTVEWEDDKGQVQLQRGWRVQHANLLGPCKGGLRFQRGLQLDTLRFLALEQTYKGALTGLPLGGPRAARTSMPKGARRGRSCASVRRS